MPSSDPASEVKKDIPSLRAERDALQRQIQRYDVVQQISQELSSELNPERLLRHTLRSAIEVMEAEAGSLLLLDQTASELEFAVVEGGGGEKLQGQRMSSRQGIAGWVLQYGEPLIVDDTLQDQRFYAQIGASVDFRTTSMICVPMLYRGRAIGVLQILNKKSGARFDASDKELLAVLAAQSAIAIRNAQLYQELREERDRLVAYEEDVRKRLARELHDGPTQLVAAVIMNLQFVRRLQEREPAKVDGEIQETVRVAEQAMHQLRTMLFDLRPVILETQGLIPALEAYSSRLTETERFAVRLSVRGQMPRLSKQAESAIFAVIQEAVGNTKKHTQADDIEIEVGAEGGTTLQVFVRDNGGGFDVARMHARHDASGSLGMINMRERAEMIGGTFELRSTIGQGTTMVLSAPISPNLP